MFELADRLVGIYKTNDATKSVTINPKLFDQGLVIQTKSHDSSSIENDEKKGQGVNDNHAKNKQSSFDLNPIQPVRVLGDVTNKK